MNLKDMQLTFSVKGEVESSNLTEFEANANQILENINTDLNTDADFIAAKQDIKDLQEVETRIANAKQKGIMSMEEVAAAMTTIDKTIDRFRNTRLNLNRTVKAEEARRKSEIVNAGIAKVAAYLTGSWVRHAFSVDSASIKDAIKNKRSISKMEEAVEEEAITQTTKVQYAEENFAENLKDIEQTESLFPGLFPDWKDIALNPNSHVLTMITARVEKFKNDQREAEEKKARLKAEQEAKIKAKQEADAKAKADREERARAEADRMATEAAALKAQTFIEPEKEITSHRGMVVEKDIAEKQPEIAPNPFVEAKIAPPPIFENMTSVLIPRFEAASGGEGVFLITSGENSITGETEDIIQFIPKITAERMLKELSVALGVV